MCTFHLIFLSAFLAKGHGYAVRSKKSKKKVSAYSPAGRKGTMTTKGKY